MQTTTKKVQCPECEAMLKAKYVAAHLEDRHNYQTGVAHRNG